VKDRDRDRLLERVERDGATVGVSIPEHVDLDGERVPLRQVVLHPETTDHDPEQVRRDLRRKRSALVERIENAEISVDEGERTADRIVGIDRGLAALETSPTDDVEADAERQERADQQRWLDFLREALGHDDESASPRPRSGDRR
jgi:hypothetical protein